MNYDNVKEQSEHKQPIIGGQYEILSSKQF